MGNGHVDIFQPHILDAIVVAGNQNAIFGGGGNVDEAQITRGADWCGGIAPLRRHPDGLAVAPPRWCHIAVVKGKYERRK